MLTRNASSWRAFGQGQSPRRFLLLALCVLGLGRISAEVGVQASAAANAAAAAAAPPLFPETYASPSAASPALAWLEHELLGAAPELAREAEACLHDLALDPSTVRSSSEWVQGDSLIAIGRAWKVRPRWISGWRAGWYNLPLVIKDEPMSELAQTRKTMGLLRPFDGLLVVGYSLLEKGAIIERHSDDELTGMRNKIVSLHMGLVVPTDGESTLTVYSGGGSGGGAEEKSTRLVLRKGEFWTFDSTYEHEAVNGGSTPRVTLYLLVDVAKFEARWLNETALGVGVAGSVSRA